MSDATVKAHPAAEIFPILEGDELQRLADDIRTNGLRIPIIILDGKVLDGRNRLAACRLAGVEPRFVEHDGSDPWRAVWSLNRERRHITDAVRLALIGEQMVRGSDGWAEKQRKATDQAREAMSGGGKKAGKGRASHEAHPKQRGDTSNKASSRLATELGVSRATVERALELRRKDAEAAGRVERGEVEGHAALREAKRDDRIAKLGEVARGNRALDPSIGSFAVIYADPPWLYEHCETENRSIENHYPTMSLNAICALPVAKLATDDAVLFLWATSPKLAEAMRVIDSWGFTYRTCAVWVKNKIGMGYYYRQRHELLLVATRGKVPVPAPADRPDSVIESPTGKHSQKPALAAEQIERMYPSLPRVELFCRSPRAGWSAWGNQAE